MYVRVNFDCIFLWMHMCQLDFFVNLCAVTEGWFSCKFNHMLARAWLDFSCLILVHVCASSWSLFSVMSSAGSRNTYLLPGWSYILLSHHFWHLCYLWLFKTYYKCVDLYFYIYIWDLILILFILTIMTASCQTHVTGPFWILPSFIGSMFSLHQVFTLAISHDSDHGTCIDWHTSLSLYELL